MRDQTVGSSSREGGAWPGKQGRLGIAIDWVTSRSSLFLRRLNVLSGPHNSATSGRRVWLFVIREVEKTPLGSMEASVTLVIDIRGALQVHEYHMAGALRPGGTVPWSWGNWTPTK